MEYMLHPWFDIAKDEYLKAAERQKNIWERSGQTEMVQERMADRAPGLLAGQKEPPPIKPLVWGYGESGATSWPTLDIPTLPNANLGPVYKTEDSWDQGYLQENADKISQRINYGLPQPNAFQEYAGMPRLTTEVFDERIVGLGDTRYTSYPNVPTTIPPTISNPPLQRNPLLEDIPPDFTTDWASYNRGY